MSPSQQIRFTSPRRSFGRSLFLVLLCVLASGALVARAQTCGFYLNATDGDDGNPGTQTLPLRSFESAFKTLPGDATVCIAAGEYFLGPDGDGIALSETGKSMTFRLESFGGSGEVRFSEGSWQLNIGSGRLTFSSGSASALVFGSGIENSDAIAPGGINFLHTVDLESGTLDVQGVSARFGSSVGNPGFVNPDNSTKTSPATASINFGSGRIVGSIDYVDAGRVFLFGSASAVAQQYPMPQSLGDSRLEFSNQGPIDFLAELSFSDAKAPLRFSSGSTGDVTFTGGLSFAGTARADTLVDHAGTGAVSIAILETVSGAGPASVSLLTVTGGGSLTLAASSYSNIGGASDWAWRPVVNTGALALGSQTAPMLLKAGLSNDGAVNLAGDLVFTGIPNEPFQNTGDLKLGIWNLTLTGENPSTTNTGSITSLGGKLVLTGSSTFSGAGEVPSVSVLSGSHTLSTSLVNGNLEILSGAEISLTATSNVGIGGNLSLGPAGTLSFSGGMSKVSVSADFVAGNGSALNIGTADLVVAGDITVPGLTVSSTVGRLLLGEGTGQHTISATGALLPGIQFDGDTLTIASDLVYTGEIRLVRGKTSVLTGFSVAGSSLTLLDGGLSLDTNASWTTSGTTSSAGDLTLGPGSLLTSGGVMTLSGAGKRVILGNNSRLDGRQDIFLSFVTVSAGPGSQIRMGAGLTVSGNSLVLPSATLVVDGNTVQSMSFSAPSRFDRLSIVGAQTLLSLDGTLSLSKPLSLSAGSLTLLQNAMLSLEGSLSRTSGDLIGSPGSTLQFTGTGSLAMIGFSGLELPSVRILGPSLTIDESTIVTEDLEIGPGSLLLGPGIDLTVGKSLTMSAGTLRVDTGSTLSVTGSTGATNSTLSFGSATTFSSSGNVRLRSGSVSASEADVGFDGGDAVALDTDLNLEFNSLSVSGAGTSLTLTGGRTVVLRSSLLIGNSTILDPGSSTIDLNGAGSTATYQCDGSFVGSSPGLVRFSGPADGTTSSMITGSGTLGNTTIDLTDSEGIVSVAPTSTVQLSGALVLSSGRVDLQGASLDFSSAAGTPSISIDLSSGLSSPRLFDSAGTNRFNTSGTRYDLSYSGSLLNVFHIGTESRFGPVRNLDIAAVDALNQPAVFGAVLSSPLALNGSLSVAQGALFQLDSTDLTILGSGTANTINGKINGSGTLIIKASGALFSNLSTNGGSTLAHVLVNTPTGAKVHLTNLGEISKLEVASGIAIVEGFTGQAAMRIPVSIGQTGGTLDIQRDLDLGTPTGAATWNSSAGQTLLRGSNRMLLSPGSTLDIGSGSSWTVQPASGSVPGSDGGFVVFQGGGFLGAASPIPRLKIMSAGSGNDDLFLTGNVTIGETLVTESGDLFIGNATLIHDGSLWQHDLDGVPGDGPGDGIFGDFSGDGGTVRINGSLELQLGGDLDFQSTTLSISAVVGDTVRVRSTDSSAHSILVSNKSFSLASGTLDLGVNDLVLQGNVSPIATLDGGSILGSSSNREVYVRGDTLSSVEYFPYSDTDSGELVLRSPVSASVVVGSPTDISNLRVDRSINFPDGNAPLIVESRLVFGESGAGITMTGSVPLTIGSGASIVRRGNGILSTAPVFGDSVSVFYDIDDGDVSGHASGFVAGTLLTGVEIPVSKPLKNLGVLSGGFGGSKNRVRLASDVEITGTLIIYGGILDKGNSSMSFGNSARLMLAGLDPVYGPGFESVTPYSTSGKFSLSVGSSSGSISITDALLPQSVTDADLTLRMGSSKDETPRNVLLTAPRSLASLTVSNLNNVSVLNTDGNLLAVSGSVAVVRGGVMSGPASLLTVGSDLSIEPAGSVSGSMLAEIIGNTIIEGEFSGLTLQVSGDLIVSGMLSPNVSLLFTGDRQSVILGASGLSVSTLTLSSSSSTSVPSPRVSLVSLSGSSVDLTVSSSLLFRNGILQTGANNVILNGSGSGFDRQVQDGDASHVTGRLRRQIANGFTGTVTWPVGDSLRYRPLALTFDSPVITDTDMTVEFVDRPPLGEVGFPIVSAGGTLLDTAPYSWTVSSSVNFARSLSWSVTLSGIGESGVALSAFQPVFRSPVDAFAAWSIPEGTLTSGIAGGLAFLKTATVSGGLDPVGTLISIGTPQRNGPAAAYQLANIRSSGSSELLDFYLDGVLLASGVAPGEATARLPVGLADATGESHTVTVMRSGEDPLSGTLASDTITIGEGLRSTIVARTASAGDTRLSSTSDQADAPDIQGNVGFTILNATMDLAALDIEAPWPMRTTLAQALSQGSFSPTAFFEPALTVVGVRRSEDGALVDHFSFDLSDAAGEIVTMFVEGSYEPTGPQSPLSMSVIREDGRILTAAVVTDTETDTELPRDFILHGNYPNPFNPVTNISFDLSEAADVHVEVYDMLGRRVQVTPTTSYAAGASSVLRLDASRLASGVYLYRVLARTSTDLLSNTSRMIVLK